MDRQQPANTDTGVPLTRSMAHALDDFIMLKLSEYGWLSTEQDNGELTDQIIRSLLSTCAGHNHRVILQILADSQTKIDLAEMMSTDFLSHDPAPNDGGLLSFTESVVKYFYDICWDQFVRKFTTSPRSQAVGNDRLNSTSTRVPQQTQPFPFFRLPAEVRNMIYEEVLVLPDGGLLRSFAPPALIHTNKRFRDEAIPIFYGANLFEITIKRSLADELLAAGRKLPSVDLWVWRRFLHMWDVFNGSGTDGLRYVNHVTLIYQLSMDNGFPFGEDGFDKRLGFRFRSHRYEEDLDTNYEEDSDGESDSDSSNNDDLEMDFAKLEAEAADLEADMDNHEGQDLDEEDNSQDESVGGVDQVPEENAGQERGFELNRGTFDWPNRRETHFFFFHRIREFEIGTLWDIYPIHRLTDMLWRCVRDCPLASENVDFLCEDVQYWMDYAWRYTQYDPVEFYDPDEEDQ